MSEPKHVSPLLDGFTLGTPLSDHGGVQCIPAIKENSDQKYIVKRIRIPASQVQLEAMLVTGAYFSSADAMEYFREVAEGYQEQAALLSRLARLEGFLGYEDWCLEELEPERTGYQLTLLGTYKRSLERYMKGHVMTHLEAVNLGLDLCQALAVCRKAGYLYIDLKPGNVFISREKEYRIGDLGFAPLDRLSTTSLPGGFVSPYAPPETRDAMNPLNSTVDTYAVGMILYQLYNDGVLPPLPQDPLTPYLPPANADYEMAGIILKAIAPEAENRWQDPIEMGKALVSYMQRNPVSAIPIAPQTALNTEGVALPPEAIPIPKAPKSEETPPAGEIPQDLPPVPEPSTEEVSQEAPSPVPETPQEEPPVLQISQEPSPADSSALAPGEEDSPDAPAEEPPAADAPEEPPEETEEPPEETEDEDCADGEAFLNMGAKPQEDPIRIVRNPDRPRTNVAVKQRMPVRRWLVPLLCSVLAVAAVFVGMLYYQSIYLLRITSLAVEGTQDQLTVLVDTPANEDLISVICSDSYGNAVTGTLENGKAVFTGLLPNSQYKVQLKAQGFHGLLGQTSDVFHTDAETQIVSINAVGGAQDGSVKLTITVDGTEPQEWTVTCTAEGEVPIVQTFTGHAVTVSGLTVDKRYTLTFSSSEEIHLTGVTTMEYTAGKLILAENLHVASARGGEMLVQWTLPEGAQGLGWTVRCYDDQGQETVQTVTEPQAVFTGIDHTRAYTVEVVADGMTLPSRTSITANPLTIRNITVDDTDPSGLTVTWEYDGAAPEGGWLLMYRLDNLPNQTAVPCQEPKAVIPDLIPGTTYMLLIQAADDATIFDNVHAYSCPEAPEHTVQGVSPQRITVETLKTPDQEDWTYESAPQEAFTSTFAPEDKLSLVLKVSIGFFLPADEVTVKYVFRDEYGNVLPDLICEDTLVWKDIWYGGDSRFGELDVPQLPGKAGEYSLRVYFNGHYLTTAEFTVE